MRAVIAALMWCAEIGWAQTPVRMRISEIQGPGEESPVVGQSVTVRGRVTARRNNGFWIESAGDADNDPRTSEGLFVFTSTNPPDVAVPQNIVEVTGTVAEFRPAADPESPPLTELVNPTVTYIGTTPFVPQSATLPSDGDWERFEGMWVSHIGSVVGPTLGSLNESTGTASSNGVVYISVSHARPFRDSSGVLGSPVVRVDTRSAIVGTGDRLAAQGPLDFAFRTYSIFSAETLYFTGSPRIAIPPPPPTTQEFTVASVNLQRLFDDKNDPDVGDVVVQTEAYQRRITKIARVIKEKLWSPDVIGLQEAENIDVLRALVAAAGDYDAHLFEGNDPGGIDVGLLVKRGRVQVIAVTQEGKSAVFATGIGLGDSALTNDRPPIVARLRVGGTPVTVIVNHLRSLIGVGTTTVDRKRRAQAEYLRDLISRLAIEGNEYIISIGDYNNFQFDPLMTTIKSAAGGLQNLTDTLSPTDGYTYIQDGVVQSLDHMLVTNAAFGKLSRYQVVRLNADYPELYRNDINRLERYSDHDVPIAYFSIAASERLRAANIRNAATLLSGPISAGEIVTIFVEGLATRVTFDGEPGRIVDSRNGQITAVVPPSVSTKSHVEVRVDSSNSVIIPVASAVPGIFGVLNQDFLVNTANRAAERGSTLMIFGTGVGQDVGVSVAIGGKHAPVTYSGPAPGLIDGVAQINARVPDDVPPGSAVPIVVWAAGNASSSTATIAIR